MHDLIVVGVPLLAILAGILLNNSNSNSNSVRIEARIDKVEATLTARIDKVEATLTARIDKVQSELAARIDRIQTDLSQFYRSLGQHDAKIEALEKRP